MESWSDFQVGEMGWSVKEWGYDGLHFSLILNVHGTPSNSHASGSMMDSNRSCYIVNFYTFWGKVGDS